MRLLDFCITSRLIFPISPRGSDLAPAKQSLSSESIPKSVTRILNAAQIRQDFKKRKLEDNGDEKKAGKRRKVDGGGSAQPKELKVQIKPGESLQHFNRFVLCLCAHVFFDMFLLSLSGE